MRSRMPVCRERGSNISTREKDRDKSRVLDCAIHRFSTRLPGGLETASDNEYNDENHEINIT
jgi:hypothetical protein